MKPNSGFIDTDHTVVTTTMLHTVSPNPAVPVLYSHTLYHPASHAHGWSSGPTSALTNYVLGLTITSTKGATWSVSPHFSGLVSAEGGFETPLGWYGVKWATKFGKILTLSLDTPAETSGSVRLPTGSYSVAINGKGVSLNGAKFNISGGKHTVIAYLK